MREILFRGKREQDATWFEGYLVQYSNKKYKESYILSQGEVNRNLDLGGRIECDMEPVLSETIGQFTGLTDKNGKKIFEGDILQCYDGVNHYTAKVTEDIANPCFALEYESGYGFTDVEYDFVKSGNMQVEVIGNIHDNAELLEEKA